MGKPAARGDPPYPAPQLTRIQEEQDVEREGRDSAILQGNPLLDPTRVGGAGAGSSFAVKRRQTSAVFNTPTPPEPEPESAPVPAPAPKLMRMVMPMPAPEPMPGPGPGP